MHAPTTTQSLNGAQEPLPGPTSWDLLFSGQDPAGCVTVDTEVLDFGTCSTRAAVAHKVLTVTNNSDAKLLSFIAVPEWLDCNGQEAAQQVYQVGASGAWFVCMFKDVLQ